MGEEKDAKGYVEGHRERLRARYRLSGEAALQDYELLELLLTFAIPPPQHQLALRQQGFYREEKGVKQYGKGL